jgi:hypothetical protein
MNKEDIKAMRLPERLAHLGWLALSPNRSDANELLRRYAIFTPRL